jgi:hypothetical protein
MTKASTNTKDRSASKTGSAKSATSKLDTLVTLLRRPAGATIDDLAKAAGWQKHSVRGALSGTLKKKGHAITSEIVDGMRRYRIEEGHA